MKRVLIVDDEPELVEIWKEILSKYEVLVDYAYNVDEGLLHLQNKEYQLVITDQKMPGGDGKILIKELNKLSTRPKIVVVSGYSIQKEENENWEYDLFIRKPFVISEILEKIESMIHQCADLK